MPEWILEISKVVIPGLFVAIIASIVTVRLSIQRFYEEKWWAKKHEIYTRLFESLHHLKKYALEHLETYDNGQEIPEEKKKELNNDWRKFTREFDKLHDLASFQLSEEAVKILDNYKKQKKAAENHENIYDWIDDDAAAAINCLELLSIEAKIDLQIKNNTNLNFYKKRKLRAIFLIVFAVSYSFFANHIHTTWQSNIEQMESHILMAKAGEVLRDKEITLTRSFIELVKINSQQLGLFLGISFALIFASLYQGIILLIPKKQPNKAVKRD